MNGLIENNLNTEEEDESISGVNMDSPTLSFTEGGDKWYSRKDLM